MPSALGLMLLGGAALLALSKGQEKPKTVAPPPTPGGGLPPPSGGVPGLPIGCQLDDNLPPSQRDMLASMLATPAPAGREAEWATGLDGVADKLASAGYPKAAACAKMKADLYRKTGKAEPQGQPPADQPPGWGGGIPPIPGGAPPPPPGVVLPPSGSGSGGWNYPGGPPPAQAAMPFVVRAGDRPYGLAVYYTGSGLRMPELATANPQMGKLITVNGVSQYENWNVGLGIAIPATWNPYNKPMPPTGL